VVPERSRAAPTEHVCLLVDPVRRPQPAGLIYQPRMRSCGGGCPLDLVGVRVSSFTEQRDHLRLGDVLANWKVQHAGKATTHPESGGLAIFAVVLAEVVVAAVRGVVRGHLARQVGVPVARRELVHRHHPTDARKRCPARDVDSAGNG